jgi:hypothetical protein
MAMAGKNGLRGSECKAHSVFWLRTYTKGHVSRFAGINLKFPLRHKISALQD